MKGRRHSPEQVVRSSGLRVSPEDHQPSPSTVYLMSGLGGMVGLRRGRVESSRRVISGCRITSRSAFCRTARTQPNKQSHSREPATHYSTAQQRPQNTAPPLLERPGLADAASEGVEPGRVELDTPEGFRRGRGCLSFRARCRRRSRTASGRRTGADARALSRRRAIRRGRGPRRLQPAGRAGEDARVPRPERGGQDDGDALRLRSRTRAARSAHGPLLARLVVALLLRSGVGPSAVHPHDPLRERPKRRTGPFTAPDARLRRYGGRPFTWVASLTSGEALEETRAADRNLRESAVASRTGIPALLRALPDGRPRRM